MRAKTLQGVLFFLLLSLVGRVEGGTAAPPRDNRLVLGVIAAPGSLAHDAALRYAGEVTARSGGRLHLTLPPAQEFGSGAGLLEMVREGNPDLALIATGELGQALPAMQLLDLPFFFPSDRLLADALDGEAGRILLARARRLGLEGLAIWENGLRHFIAKRPIRSPGDFADLPTLVARNRMVAEQFRLLGAPPVSMEFYASRRAVVDGVVAAQENTLSSIVELGLHEVYSHLTLSGHAWQGYLLAINRRRLAALDGEGQRLLRETAREVTLWAREENARREAAWLATIERAKVRVHRLTTGERERFLQELAHLPRRFAEMIGFDLIAKSEELFLLNRLATREENGILVGLNVQLSGEGAMLGLEIAQGVALAIDEINGATPGGQALRLMVRDHAGLARRGVENLRFFAGLERLVAVIGGDDDTVAEAETAWCAGSSMPCLFAWASGPELAGEGVYRVGLNDRWAVPYLVEAALARGRRMALVLENSPRGRRLAGMARGHAHDRAGEIVGVWWLEKGQVSATREVDAMGASGAEVVLLAAPAGASRMFLRELIGRFPNLPVVAHQGVPDGAQTGEQARMLAKMDLVFPRTVFLSVPGGQPAGIQLLGRQHAALRMEPEESLRRGAAFAQAYDLTRMLGRAIGDAGASPERGAVRAALERLRGHEGVIRRYDRPFATRPRDALRGADYRLGRMTEDGRVVTALAGR
ncbi:MAG: TRAP transporter substrate-binding protein DctP [Magnetococcales bacterium]|nr:TRAP transporter substrate-binding protein DctP [Magnetococcales bacterium]